MLVMLLAACSEVSDDAGLLPVGANKSPVAVETLQLKPEKWRYSISNYGQLKVAETVAIGVEQPGLVSRLLVAEGQRVSEGQLLFELEARKQQSRYERAAASIEEAQSELTQARKNLDQFTILSAKGTISENQLTLAQTDYRTVSARLAQARAALALARAELAERRISSPVNGIVAAEYLEVGQNARPGEQLILIQADGAWQVRAHVNETEVVNLARGQDASVTVVGSRFPAKVESIGRRASTTTGNYAIKLRVETGDTPLREGMSALVTLTVTRDEEVILIPREAVVDRQREQVVFVVRDGRAARLSPELGLPMDRLIPVTRGLEGGDLLILYPLDRIADGSPVTRAEEEEP